MKEDFITAEIDSELIEQFNEIFGPQGITPEDAVRAFLEFCATPGNEKEVEKMLKG